MHCGPSPLFLSILKLNRFVLAVKEGQTPRGSRIRGWREDRSCVEHLVCKLGLVGSQAIAVLTIPTGPCRGGSIEQLACGLCGICRMCRHAQLRGAAVSGHKCCPLAAILHTNEKQTHVGGEATGHRCPLWTEVEMASAAWALTSLWSHSRTGLWDCTISLHHPHPILPR